MILNQIGRRLTESQEVRSGDLKRRQVLLPNATLVELLRLLSPLDLQGDAFGKV